MFLVGVAGVLVWQHTKEGGTPLKGRHPSAYTLEQEKTQRLSKKMMAQGRRQYQAGEYKKSNRTLNNLLQSYPYSGYREEASFLLAQGLFYEGHFAESEKAIQLLQDSDPGSLSPWVGRALLVRAQIYEKWDQKEQAVHLYRRIVTEFSTDRELAEQAEEHLINFAF